MIILIYTAMLTVNRVGCSILEDKHVSSYKMR